MKKLSPIFSILALNFTMGYGMELITIADTNLDTLHKELVIEIQYHLNNRRAINAIRCINKSCNEKVPSQEKLNEYLLSVVPKAYQDDMDGEPFALVHLQYWSRCGAYPTVLFFNFLETDQNKLARFIYSECGLSANDELERAAKYGNIKATELLIADYYADDTSRALITAVSYGCKDLATMLIRNHKASFPFVRKTAAQDGNLKLFNLCIEFYPQDKDALADELKPFLPETAQGCPHSDLENCGHKDIITLLISEYQLPNLHQTLFSATGFGRVGMVKWLITHYKSSFNDNQLNASLLTAVSSCSHSDSENCGHKDIIKLLISEYQLSSTHETLIQKIEFGQEGIFIWLITQYKSSFNQKTICAAISKAEEYERFANSKADISKNKGWLDPFNNADKQLIYAEIIRILKELITY